jgi:DNA-binding PadR family transcriptional regulator
MAHEYQLPLTPLSTGILLALAAEDLHGYALMKAVEEQSGGVLTSGTGTLYAALARLLEDGLIVECEGVPQDQRRGKTYTISEAGRGLLRAETSRLAAIVRRAREVQVGPDPEVVPEGSR